jgi:hypothetical protein
MKPLYMLANCETAMAECSTVQYRLYIFCFQFYPNLRRYFAHPPERVSVFQPSHDFFIGCIKVRASRGKISS